MLALQKTCVHASTQLSYIKSISGGKDSSIENLQAGLTHAFVVQFLAWRTATTMSTMTLRTKPSKKLQLHL
ncbi:hypothetical protein BCR34DRAFT_306332 [Clohesyomyces aquaticus]|uniref:Uncharacterized protein n=1 Tax=Clohesyomyces aquaticus TaxID=1231657 RepID=A0A1Y1ZR22_9PLEO|nr:hypothetical protein BCR34DRAFT_306332 [Clohesyomyces aquaticus]